MRCAVVRGPIITGASSVLAALTCSRVGGPPTPVALALEKRRSGLRSGDMQDRRPYRSRSAGPASEASGGHVAKRAICESTSGDTQRGCAARCRVRATRGDGTGWMLEVGGLGALFSGRSGEESRECDGEEVGVDSGDLRASADGQR